MIYLIFGDDDYLAHEELARIRAPLGPEDMLDLNTTRLAGDGLTFPELRAVCDAVPFLAQARLVIVEGLLGHFEERRTAPRSPRSRPTSTSARLQSQRSASAINGTGLKDVAAGQKGDWDQLPGYSRAMPETTHLVLLEGPLRRNNPLLALLTPIAELRQTHRLRGPALEQWARQRVASLGCTITPTALKLLTDTAEGSLWVVANELEKLALYANGLAIGPEHVRELVAPVRESTIFTLIDAVATRRIPTALRALHNLLRDGAAPPFILFMVARQFRLLLVTKALSEQGLSGARLMNRLAITSDYAFRKTVEQAQGYTKPALAAILGRLLDSDVAIKTGQLSPETALELLVLDLCRAAP